MNHRVRTGTRQPRRLRAAFGLALSMTVLATTLLLASCGDGDSKGGQCEPCRDSEPRCDSGLNCSLFGNQNLLVEWCASPGTRTCP